MTPGGDLALGVDVGTSGVRGAVLDAGGEILATASASMEEVGSNRRDPAVWASAFEIMLARLARLAPLAEVAAVAVDGTSGTVLATDAAGRPLADALMYNDAVQDPAIPAGIAAVAPRESAAHGAASALARAIVLQEQPGCARILHQADWIAGQLSGRFDVSDESNALKSGYDPQSRCWPAWLEGTPVDPSRLPDVVPVGTQTGSVRAAASHRFGLAKGACVVAGLSDGCASFLATGAARPGDGVTALGTTLTIKLLSDKPIFAPEYGIYSHRIGDIWLAGGASNTGGGVLEAHFTPAQLTALSSRIDPARESGLDYYPLSKPGERFPISDPDHQPRLSPRPAEDSEFLLALLEGMAGIEALGYRRLAELDAPSLKSLRSVGGGAANPLWTAKRAAALKVPMLPAASEEAAAGVASLALAHLGRRGSA